MVVLLFVIIIGLCVLYFWYLYTMQNDSAQKELAAKYNQHQNDDELLADIELMAKKAQAFIQANLSGHEVVADAINSGSYTGPLPEKRDDGGWLSVFDNLRILKIAGINHRKNIGQYTGRVECALVPEPSNEFDPNAIKVVAEDKGVGLVRITQGESYVCSISLLVEDYRVALLAHYAYAQCGIGDGYGVA